MSDKPIYCKECHSRNSFKRDRQGDIYGVNEVDNTERLMWKAWRCSCGHKTLNKWRIS